MNARYQRIVAIMLSIMLLFTLFASQASAEAGNKSDTAASTGAVGGLGPSGTSKGAAAGITDPKELERFADGFFAQKEIKELQVPGALLVVVKDGKILLNKGYGYADVASKKPIDPEHTGFRLASVSKVFTATALMQLVEQGKVGLKDDIMKHLPGIPLTNPYADKNRPVTVEDLLTHTTGFDFADPLDSDVQFGKMETVTMEQYANSYMPSVEREPGSSYSYDNFASMLQGLIVEKVSGQPFETYVEQQLFQPLAMSSSSFLLTDKMKKQLATAYQAGPKGVEALPMYNLAPTVMPQGGMISTGKDIAHFMIAQLNGGIYDGNRILTEASVNSMQQIHEAIHPKLPNMGYGFEFGFHELANGQFSPGKGGDIPGFSSWMWLLPEHNTGVFIIYNINGNLREKLYEAFMDHYFPAQDSASSSWKPDPKELERYTGLYRDLRMGDYLSKVSVGSGGTLVVEDPYFGKHELTPVEPLLFRDSEGKLMAFRENEDGSIIHMMYQNPSAYSIKLAAVPFTDIADDSPYKRAVETLHQLNAYGDYGDKFEPGLKLTRAEFAVQLVRTFHFRPSVNTPVFKDLEGRSEAPYVQLLVEEGLFQGDPKGMFRPDEPVTRQEMAVLLWRIFQYLGLKPTQQVKLSGITDAWAVDSVKAIAGLGFAGPDIKPAKDGSIDFESKRPVTRQEGAYYLYQYLKVLMRTEP